HTTSICRHCGSPTALVAIAVPPGHETLDPDESAEGASAWSVADHNAFLFHIEYLPAAVLDLIRRRLPSFRSTGAEPQWTNHCERCGRALDDDELFCEPEGAFLPTSESAAAAIRIETVGESFQAFAAGYSFEPPYFSAISRG